MLFKNKSLLNSAERTKQSFVLQLPQYETTYNIQRLEANLQIQFSNTLNHCSVTSPHDEPAPLPFLDSVIDSVAAL